ncbi:MAG: ParB/RepB/Spo0J family partition protein [Oligoflexales bacterium]|nr:ParB/RepB/Spo0J family partition protein [Oligoflexales bacterium]
MASEEENKRKGALGKGLQTLIRNTGDSYWEQGGHRGKQGESNPEAQVFYVDPSLIDPNPEQPRKFFKQEELKNLSQSIALDGVLQPLIVVNNANLPGRFLLIAGERRLRASKMAGLQKIPVIIKNTSPDDRLRVALIENIQRADLNIIEEAMAYEALIKEYGLTQEQCAEKVGKDRSTITNALRILSLPRTIHEDLCEQRLSMGHARAFLSLGSSHQIQQARDIVIRKGLSVRKTELLCRNLSNKAASKNKGQSALNLDPDIEYIADNLRNFLRTKVKISGSAQRGKIEVSYFSTAELERILGLISKKM